jgi:hypothetical protein
LAGDHPETGTSFDTHPGDTHVPRRYADKDISYCWHPKRRILVGGAWWCQWWEEIPEDA